jgi:hypothetical protein
MCEADAALAATEQFVAAKAALAEVAPEDGAGGGGAGDDDDRI